MHSNFFFFQQLTILIVIFYHCVQKKLSESLAFSNHMHVVNCEKQCKQVDDKSKFDKTTYRIMFHTETRNLSNQLEGKGKITTFNIYLACWHKSVCFKLLQQVCITNAIILWGCISWKASTWFFSFHPCWTLPKHSKSALSDGKEL